MSALPDPKPFRLGAGSPDGPAVLCIHGLTGTPYEVRPPAEALAERGFTCHGLLLPGHGTTPDELNRVPWGDWVRAACAAWDELAAVHPRVYGLGLSLGGLLTLALAQRRELPGAVVMAAPLRLSRSVRWGIPVLHRVLGSVPKTPGILDDDARGQHPGYDRMPLSAVNQMLRLARDVEAGLGRITAPLQVIYSRLDDTVALADAERIRGAAAATTTEVHVLSDSGHVLPVDRERSRVAETVADFLCRLEKDAVDAPAGSGES